MQVEFTASHINTCITSVNVGKFYRILTCRFSFWALFDMQLMNSILKHGFSDYSQHKGSTVFTLKICEWQTLIAHLE